MQMRRRGARFEQVLHRRLAVEKDRADLDLDGPDRVAISQRVEDERLAAERDEEQAHEDRCRARARGRRPTGGGPRRRRPKAERSASCRGTGRGRGRRGRAPSARRARRVAPGDRRRQRRSRRPRERTRSWRRRRSRSASGGTRPGTTIQAAPAASAGRARGPASARDSRGRDRAQERAGDLREVDEAIVGQHRPQRDHQDLDVVRVRRDVRHVVGHAVETARDEDEVDVRQVVAERVPLPHREPERRNERGDESAARGGAGAARVARRRRAHGGARRSCAERGETRPATSAATSQEPSSAGPGQPVRRPEGAHVEMTRAAASTAPPTARSDPRPPETRAYPGAPRGTARKGQRLGANPRDRTRGMRGNTRAAAVGPKRVPARASRGRRPLARAIGLAPGGGPLAPRERRCGARVSPARGRGARTRARCAEGRGGAVDAAERELDPPAMARARAPRCPGHFQRVAARSLRARRRLPCAGGQRTPPPMASASSARRRATRR